jgi:hypothetical protein
MRSCGATLFFDAIFSKKIRPSFPHIQFSVFEIILPVFFPNLPNNPAGRAKRHHIRRHIVRDDAPSAYYGVIPYRHPGQYLGAGANPYIPPYAHRQIVHIMMFPQYRQYGMP